VVFDVHVPATYPSDAQLDASGAIVVVDYANPGAILRVSPTGRLLWRYQPRSGTGRLDHPSLAVPLANGTIVLNDDLRHRVIVVDPVRGRIVWQYGHTDRPGRRPGFLWVPDGIDVVPVGILPQT
jgi:outer membrane protein assembly factor BamB